MARLSPKPYPRYPAYPDDAHTNPASFADYQAKRSASSGTTCTRQRRGSAMGSSEWSLPSP